MPSRHLGSAGLTIFLPPRVVLARMGDKDHFHVCTGCRGVYRENCDDPFHNGLCKACKGRPRPIWDSNLDHVACCTNLSQVTDTVTVAKYNLAGPGPWFCCTVCYRFHGKRKDER